MSRNCEREANALIRGAMLDEDVAAADRFARETRRGERHGYYPAGERAHRFAFDTMPAPYRARPFDGRVTAPLRAHLRR